MIAYVESNFVLELVLGQEEADDAEALLSLAESGSVQLVIPSFSLFEPFSTVKHRSRERRKIANTISETARQLTRSSPHQAEASQLSAALAGLVAIAQREDARLQATVERLLSVARSVEMDATRFSQAIGYQRRYGLDAGDAVVYASIVGDLHLVSLGEAKCFVTRNSDDFDDPDISTELGSYNCRILFHFSEAVQYCTP